MIVRAILVAAAVVLAGASLIMSLAFVSSMDNVTLRNVFIAVAVASCAIKLGVPAYFATTRRPWRSNGALVATWLMAFLLDASFVGAFMTGTRDADTRDRQAAYDARRVLERERDTALKLWKAERDKERRPIELVVADLEAAKRASGRCDTPAAAAADRCSAVSVRERELADHKALERLKADYDAAAAKLAASKEVIVYPEAARFGAMLRSFPALSWVEDAHVAMLIWLVMLGLFEYGALTIVKAALAGAPAASAPSVLQPPARVAPHVSAAVPRHDALFQMLADGAAGAGALASARLHDGRVKVSQKATAPLVGMSPRAFGAALADLQKLGRIDLVSGSRGTFVRVIS